MKDNIIIGFLIFLILALLIGIGVAIRVYVPCSVWNLGPAKDVPGRCITVQVRQ